MKTVAIGEQDVYLQQSRRLITQYFFTPLETRCQLEALVAAAEE
jgi:hypothetical protein